METKIGDETEPATSNEYSWHVVRAAVQTTGTGLPTAGSGVGFSNCPLNVKTSDDELIGPNCFGPLVEIGASAYAGTPTATRLTTAIGITLLHRMPACSTRAQATPARSRLACGAMGSSGLLTVPNAVSVLRLLGVPLFLWLALGPHEDGWAIFVLAMAGLTDYLDGKLARLLNQQSRIGALLDPFADRLYVLATVSALTVRGIIPLVLTALLVSRDVVLAGFLPVLRKHGYGPLPVNFTGKAATFALLYAFPLLLLGDDSGLGAQVAAVIGWAFTVWGTTLYWWAGVLYIVQVRQLVVADSVATPEFDAALTPADEGSLR